MELPLGYETAHRNARGGADDDKQGSHLGAFTPGYKLGGGWGAGGGGGGGGREGLGNCEREESYKLIFQTEVNILNNVQKGNMHQRIQK